MHSTPTTELFQVGVATRNSCREILGDDAELAITPLAVAAFHLQAAWTGARMASLASDPSATTFLRDLVVDYDGVVFSALNLSVRSAVTVVDLCGTAMSHLAGLSAPDPSYGLTANQFVKLWKTSGSLDSGVRSIGDWFADRLSDHEWTSVRDLRHALTHRNIKRRVYGTTESAPDPRSMVHPNHIDVYVEDTFVPLDKITHRCATFADELWREFCSRLTDLGVGAIRGGPPG